MPGRVEAPGATRYATCDAGSAIFSCASLERRHGELEILTTSQKLAHRIVHELVKQFRGRATYAWSDDGTLFTTWQRER